MLSSPSHRDDVVEYVRRKGLGLPAAVRTLFAAHAVTELGCKRGVSAPVEGLRLRLWVLKG
jgi:hypothetical protein